MIAVPDNRLVTSVLHLNKYVTIGVNVFSHGSSIFMLIAPVSVSIVDLVKRERRNHALHLPHLLSLQPEDALFFLEPFLFKSWSQLCTLDLNKRSSIVFVTYVHQLDHFEQGIQSIGFSFSLSSIVLWLILHNFGGGSGKV